MGQLDLQGREHRLQVYDGVQVAGFLHRGAIIQPNDDPLQIAATKGNPHQLAHRHLGPQRIGHVVMKGPGQIVHFFRQIVLVGSGNDFGAMQGGMDDDGCV